MKIYAIDWYNLKYIKIIGIERKNINEQVATFYRMAQYKNYFTWRFLY